MQGERGVLVYNLEKIGENKYDPKLVQAIIPDLSDYDLIRKIGNYTPNYVVDTDNDQFIIIGYPNNSWYELTGQQPIAVLPIPNVTLSQEYVLTDKDIVDSFSLPITIAPQQSFYYDGKVYPSGGDKGQASLRVIDMESKDVVYYRDMTEITKGEPQFLGLWNNKMLYCEYDSTGLVYEIIIPENIFKRDYQTNDNKRL